MNFKRILILLLSIIIILLGCSCNKTTTNSETNNIEYKNYTINQLTNATISNDIELVNNIIKSGSVDINSKDSNGRYPLETTIAIYHNCEMSKILLDAGADPYVSINNKTIYETVMDSKNVTLKNIFKEHKNRNMCK